MGVQYSILPVVTRGKTARGPALSILKNFTAGILLNGCDLFLLRQIETACGVRRQVLLVSARSIYYSPATVAA